MKKIKLLILSMLSAISFKAATNFDELDEQQTVAICRACVQQTIPDEDNLHHKLAFLKKGLAKVTGDIEKKSILLCIKVIQQYKVDNLEQAYEFLENHLNQDLRFQAAAESFIDGCHKYQNCAIPNLFQHVMPDEYCNYIGISTFDLADMFTSMPMEESDALIEKIKNNIRALLESKDEVLESEKGKVIDVQFEIFEIQTRLGEPLTHPDPSRPLG